ncbi:agamous-like MADS-box protein AGL62 [Amaranthus tricolor]|uniref:agamous-like MADS-box protein AGL62 n=1 Tax=Amaranthus tricolor TaxID=29722 RepID=UPI00258CD7B3|nr:agamous-like MADS-box protein AGL62 [Amaranthus tricolor]
MAKKESRGRQKIKMARIKNPSHRQVTFSKRRLGLFKKASEICTLCGVEAIIIVFSPGQKIFSFGHPSVEAIVNRYLSRNPSCPPQISSSNAKNKKEDGDGIEQLQSSTMNELNSQLTKIFDLLEAEKSRGESLNNLRRSFGSGFGSDSRSRSSQCQWWWEAPIDTLRLHELEILGASMEDLNKNIANQAIVLEKTNSQHLINQTFS